MFQIPRLDAVNRILKPINGSKTSSLEVPTNNIVNDISMALDIAAQKIQFENEWNFNTAYAELTSNLDSQVEVPTDWLFIKFGEWSEGSPWDLTVKNDKLWNRRTYSDIITGTVRIMGTRLFSYDECPAIIQSYIIEKGKFELLGLNTHLSVPRNAIYNKLEMDAFNAAIKWDSEQKFGVLDISPSMRDMVRKNNTPGYWWR
jgi:hypothetical protein